MDQIVGALMGVAIFFAVVYAVAHAVARVVLDPIHAKLDRLLDQQAQLLARDSTEAARQ